MELKFLEIFCKVVELKSFSKAASELFLTQPTISNHIKTLEDAAGIQFLDRLGRNVLPTKAGEILYRYAKEIVKLKSNAIQELNEFMGNVKGSLIIGGSTIPGEYILPEYIAKFKMAHPDVAVTLKLGDTQDIIDMIMDSTVEIGVIGSKPVNERIDSREFIEDELVLVAPTKHFKGIRNQVGIRDLEKLPLIMREKGSGSRKALEQTLKKNGINIEELNIAAEVGSTEAVKQSVRAGIGISFLSRFAVKDEIPRKTLRKISVVNGFNISRHFYIATDKARAISPICQAFINNLLNLH
ncbi:MAG: LysR family transcriptional regulator [Deltaproteobacteria bacterium]|nr:LysR family transcriptional regulator [Deltaproteobacteria bacterium]